MNPISCFESLIDVASPNIIQGDGNAQTQTALLWSAPLGRASGTQQRVEGVAVGFYSLLNRSGGAAYVGLGVRIPNHYWIAGQWDDSGGPSYISDTADAQDRDADDFALETLTINDGFVVASRVSFNAILIDVTTASALAVGDPVRAARYSDSAGTGWSALTTILHTAAAVEYSTSAETVIAWDVPTDWGLTTGLVEIPNGYYAVNVRATTTPDTTAGLANSLSLYRFYFLESIANNATKEMNFSPAEAWMPYGDAVSSFFSTANASNRVTALLRPRG